MKFILMNEYYERELGSNKLRSGVYTLLCDTYQEAYDNYTKCIDRHIAEGVCVKTEQTFRIHSGSCARCEFSDGLVTSIQQLKHPKMETEVS